MALDKNAVSTIGRGGRGQCSGGGHSFTLNSCFWGGFVAFWPTTEMRINCNSNAHVCFPPLFPHSWGHWLYLLTHVVEASANQVITPNSDKKITYSTACTLTYMHSCARMCASLLRQLTWSLLSLLCQTANCKCASKKVFLCWHAGANQ